MNEAGKRKIVRMCGVRERMHVERERERVREREKLMLKYNQRDGCVPIKRYGSK